MADLRYDQFTHLTPTGPRIILHADPSNGDLNKCDLNELQCEPITQNPPLYLLQQLGLPVIAYTFNMGPWGYTTGQLIGNGVLNFVGIIIPNRTLTGVVTTTINTASYTATGLNGLALYKFNGTSLDLVAQTASTTTPYTGTAYVPVYTPFTSTYAAAAGVYAICYRAGWSAVTTIPSLMGFNFGNFSVNQNGGLASNHLFRGSTGVITSFSANITTANTATGLQTLPQLGVY